MRKFFFIILIFNFLSISCYHQNRFNVITPNQFKGSDTQRIQAAIDKAAGTKEKIIIIPAVNSNGAGVWLIDNAILLPDSISVILDNCILQLSDSCRDNMFRSNNVGIGITEPNWVRNISIVGMGNVLLKGANNPRSTGDGGKKLSMNPENDMKKLGDWKISYGTDAGKENEKQTGDWRNIMVLMAYVDGFKFKNVNIEKTHAWAISHERVLNAELSNIRINNPAKSIINNKEQLVRNRDGINLRHGCKNFRIDNISGKTGDDFIALSTLGIYSEESEGGSLNSTMVTSRNYKGVKDDTENIYITNIVCKSDTRAIAIRANDIASTNNVYINGVMFKGGHNAMLVGGRGYGKDSQPGKINNIHATNLIGDGQSLIQIEEAISDCSFINSVYEGKGEQIVMYKLDKSKTSKITTHNLIKLIH